MKKTVIILIAVILVLSLSGCGNDGNPSPKPEPDGDYIPDPSLVYTAEFVASCEQTSDEYDDFYQNADFHCAIPGLKQKFIPQGVAYDEFTSQTYITGYFDDNQNSVIFVMDKNGNFVKEIILSLSDSEAYTGHSGGIAVTEKHVFVSNGKKLYHLSKQAITSGGAHLELSFDGYARVDVNASYVSYSDGKLFVGEFEYAKNSYVTDMSHHVLTADDDLNTALTLMLDVDENSTFGIKNVSSSGDWAVPSLAFSHTERIQGFDYDAKNNLAVLSQSYGRKNDSTLFLHTVVADAFERTIELSQGTAKLVILDQSNLTKTVVCPPMTEDVDVCNGRIYICFESAAYKYYEGANLFNKAINPIDSIFYYVF